jgi:hypothetical protein
MIEYARILRTWNGKHSDALGAWLATGEILTTPSVKIRGLVSYADTGYNLYYTTINPYFEMTQYTFFTSPALKGAIPWERWMRCALISPGTRLVGSIINFKVGDTPMELRYATLHRLSTAPPFVGDYRNVLALTGTRKIVNGLDVNVSYATEWGAKATRKPLQLVQAAAVVSF